MTKPSKEYLDDSWIPRPGQALLCVIETDEKWDRTPVGFVSLLPVPLLSSPFQSLFPPPLRAPSGKSPECERLHLFLQQLFCSAIKPSSPWLPRKLEPSMIAGETDGAQSPGPGVRGLRAHPHAPEGAAFWRPTWGCRSWLGPLRNLEQLLPSRWPTCPAIVHRLGPADERSWRTAQWINSTVAVSSFRLWGEICELCDLLGFFEAGEKNCWELISECLSESLSGS